LLASAIALFVGGAAVGARVAVSTHNVALAIATGLGIPALSFGLILISRLAAERTLAAQPISVFAVSGNLDFSSLPQQWQKAARDTLGGVGARVPSMGVTLTTEDGYLRIAKRRVAFTAKFPFAAKVPLTSIDQVRVGKSYLSIGGSSLNISLANGGEIRVELRVGQVSANEVATRLRNAISKAALREWGSPSGADGLEIISPPPPARTSPGRSFILASTVLPVWVVAMVGARHGPIAAAVTTLALFGAQWLNFTRSLSIRRVIPILLAACAFAFIGDGVLTDEPIRLVGAALSGLLAVCVARQSRPPHPSD